MFRTVRGRLVLSYLLVGLVAALGVGLVTYLIASSYFRGQEIEYLTRNASEIAVRVGSIMESQEDWSFLPKLITNWERFSKDRLQNTVSFYSFWGQKRIVVLDASGGTLADSGQVPPFHLVEMANWGQMPGWEGGVLPNVIQMQVISGETHGHATIQSFASPSLLIEPNQFGWGYALDHLSEELPAGGTNESTSNLVVQVPIRSATGRDLGALQLSEGPAYGKQILRTIRLALGGGLLAAVLLAVVVGLITARQLTRPLALLGGAAEQMAAGDLSARAPNGRRDEFGQLARQFNQMAEALQANLERLAADREALRRFIADASHELRTPLTALKSFNALLTRESRLDEAKTAELQQASGEQIARLDALTQGLLDLSRLNASLSAEEMIVDDLQPIIQRAASVFRPLMAEMGQTLSVSLPADPIPALHDPAYLRRAIDNLLGNALKFTPAGGQISIGLELQGDEIEIWVADDGPGISEEELPQVFDRFYRGRNAAGTEGSGLGLAIVKAVALAHGGRVAADGSAGTRISIFVPLRQ